MFQYWPFSTDVRMRYIPFANGLLIVLTVSAYILIGPATRFQSHPMILEPGSVTGLFGHIWMHADFYHIFGNMLFLWVFGNAVCSRVGNLWFPLIYVGLGVMAGMGQLFYHLGQSVGASGAINGIIGMFVILFPASKIKMIYTVAYTTGGTTKVPSMFLVPAWFVFDVVGALRGDGNIGYGAHIAGFLAGVLLAGGMLRVGWVQPYQGEKTLPEILRLGWPTEDRKEPLPELSLPLEQLDPGYVSPPEDVVRHARGRELAERSFEPVLDGTSVLDMPRLRADGTENFEPWRPAGGNIWLRCLCGSSLTFLPDHAGKKVHCPGCGREIDVPAPARDNQASDQPSS